jgi:hypothetical protein
MATLWIVVAATLAASPAEDSTSAPTPNSRSAIDLQPDVTPRQLRATISDALRREATTHGSEHDVALRELITVYQHLEADSQLPDRERRKRLGQIRHRLARATEGLQKQVARAAGDPAAAKPSAGRILAQRVPAIAGQRAANPIAQQPAAGQLAPQAAGQTAGTVPGEADQARQLIELIQTTIAPDTWDVRGGPGTIFYFAPKKVLVIRQTGEVHDGFRNLFRQLRGN